MISEINKHALFHDGSEEFVKRVNERKYIIRFRVAIDDVDSVWFCENHQVISMTKSESDHIFEYYEILFEIENEKAAYYFKVIKGTEEYYYDICGPHHQLAHPRLFMLNPEFSVPEWAKGAVMYQIYVDRFCNGDETNDVVDNEYIYINEKVKKVQDWNKIPDTMDVRNFYGGDLQGVLNKLDYLEKLGIEVIYFNPLFVSPSNHKYDIQDYDYIDPHFGKIVKDSDGVLSDHETNNKNAYKYITRVTDRENLEASNNFFAQVVEEIHNRGMKVIIDGVFNHCGSFNKWMDKERIYENAKDYEKGAFLTEDSPYKKYFNFHDSNWPNNNSYDGWWGHDTLPKLNYEGSEELYNYIMYIARKWVSPPYNVDGWRLDVAADLGYTPEFNHKFWKDFRKNVKEANPNAIIIAEHYGDPSAWLQGDEWDTVMNYDGFMEPISWFLTGMQKHSDEYKEGLIGNTDVFFDSMCNAMSQMQHKANIVAMNELSNHDHSRFMTRTNKKVGRSATMGAEAASQNVNKAIFKTAVIMQMTWPGSPTLYYGDEAGVCGWTDPDNRRTYPWGNEDLELVEFYRDAIRIHRRNKSLRKGAFIPMYNTQDILIYGRFLEENALVTVIHNGQEEKQLEIPIWRIGAIEGATIERLILSGKDNYNVGKINDKVVNGAITITMPPESGAIYRIKI